MGGGRSARRPRARAAPGRALLASLLLAPTLLASAGCTVPISRGTFNDFFVKDYNLPAYRRDEAALGRRRHLGAPTGASGALGGLAGALAGGRLRAWSASAGGAVGGMGGALLGRTLMRTEQHEPLPARYQALTLALPIIATDPNKGPTFGLLPVAVFKEQERITNILAPDLTYNEIDGFGGAFRMRRFFSTDAALELDLAGSSEGAFNNRVVFSQRRVGPRQFLFYRGEVSYLTDLSTRFYGLGNDTEEDDEASYVLRQTLFAATFGVQLPLDFTLELQERVASYKVGPGRLDGVRSARAAFPGVDGMRGRTTLLTHRLQLTYDSRDARGAPTRGILAQFTYEIADTTLGSGADFQRFGLSVTALFPKFKRRFVTAARAAGWIVTGDEVPFYALTQLGGKHTHRGYGQGRFVDQNGWLASVEERWNVTSLDLMGTKAVLQLAGFVDAGRVLPEGGGFKLDKAKLAAGAAIRLVLPDSDLVTSIDVGFSDEGPAAFVGLDYPF